MNEDVTAEKAYPIQMTYSNNQLVETALDWFLETNLFPL